jgi:hypothetical protein
MGELARPVSRPRDQSVDAAIRTAGIAAYEEDIIDLLVDDLRLSGAALASL